MGIYISHRLTIICAQKWGFWGFWRWRCENIVFWPPKRTTLREYASVDISRDKIGSTAWALGPWKYFAYNFGYMGEVTPGAILTKCGLWGDMVDVITCAIFRDCRLSGVGVVRKVSLPSPIDLTRRPYNTGHTTVWPCDHNSVIHFPVITVRELYMYYSRPLMLSVSSRASLYGAHILRHRLSQHTPFTIVSDAY